MLKVKTVLKVQAAWSNPLVRTRLDPRDNRARSPRAAAAGATPCCPRRRRVYGAAEAVHEIRPVRFAAKTAYKLAAPRD